MRPSISNEFPSENNIYNNLNSFDYKILVITQSKFTLRDYERFGVKFLAANGFEISVFDFSPMLRETAYVNSLQPGELVDFPRLFRIFEISQFEACLVQQGLINGYALCFMELLRREIPVFRSLSKFRIKYCHFIIGVLPGIQPSLRRIVSRINYLFKVHVIYRGEIEAADAVFCAGKKARQQLGFKKGSETLIMDVGSFDYNTFLNRLPELQREDEGEASFVYPDIVFVDQFFPHHPDFGGKPIIEATKYYSLLNRYLEELSRQLRLTIGIAAHPRSDYRENPFAFPLYRNETIQMIYPAKAVVGHFSTAFGYAMLLNKPIVQLSFKEMSGTVTYKTIEKLSLEIGAEIVYLDTEIPALLSIPVFNRKKYEYFISQYMISDRNMKKPDLQEALLDYLLSQ